MPWRDVAVHEADFYADSVGFYWQSLGLCSAGAAVIGNSLVFTA